MKILSIDVGIKNLAFCLLCNKEDYDISYNIVCNNNNIPNNSYFIKKSGLNFSLLGPYCGSYLWFFFGFYYPGYFIEKPACLNRTGNLILAVLVPVWNQIVELQHGPGLM